MYVDKTRKGYGDIWMTPPDLAQKIVDHFAPKGVCLDPARGDGAFFNAFPGAKDWCEITEGRDFLTSNSTADWVITNPPWSIFRKFLIKAFSLASNVVLLVPVYHAFTSARYREMLRHGFAIKEICMVEPPKTFPVMGFVLAAIHWEKKYSGPIIVSNL
jgi:hypothetical protein